MLTTDCFEICWPVIKPDGLQTSVTISSGILGSLCLISGIAILSLKSYESQTNKKRNVDDDRNSDNSGTHETQLRATYLYSADDWKKFHLGAVLLIFSGYLLILNAITHSEHVDQLNVLSRCVKKYGSLKFGWE